MRRILTAATLLVAVMTAGCVTAPRRFAIADCRTIWVLEKDPDCKDDAPRWKRTAQTHCAVSDHLSGCKVGAIRHDNPDFSPTDSSNWWQPKYLYARLYDWECPTGVAPPTAKDFYFISTLVAPMACDDEDGNPLPSNPLLRPNPPPAPPPLPSTPTARTGN